MATARKPATPARRAPAPGAIQKYELVPVEFIETNLNTALAVDHDMTKEGFTEAPNDLAPTAQWSRLGQFTEGIYLGLKDETGPNKQRLYQLQMADGEIVGVWGATVLDNRMDLLFAQGLAIGDTVRIIYAGDAPAKAGQNAARIYKVGYKKG